MTYNKDNIEGLQFICNGSLIIYTINKIDEKYVRLTWVSPKRGSDSDIYSIGDVLRKINNNQWKPINVNYEIY